MVRPDVYACPVCLTPVSGLCLRVRTRTDEEGNVKFAGQYTGCECGSLTKNGDGVVNLLSDIATELGIRQKTTASTLARIKPTIRRK